MSIYRVVKDRGNPYVMINKCAIVDNSLSYKAKGILMYLLSKPDNWQVYEKEIVKHSTDGRDAVRSGLQELVKAGYIKRDPKRNERGQFKGYEYSVYEVPHRSGKPDFGKPDIGKLALNNKGPKINNEITKERYYYFFEGANKVSCSQLPKEGLIYFIAQYHKHFNKPHKKIKQETIEKCLGILDRLVVGNIEDDYGNCCITETLEELKLMIDKYFDTEFKEVTDYSLPHFCSEKLLTNLWCKYLKDREERAC